MEPLEAGDPAQLGSYRLVARLGAGGMGRVYLARSRGGRRVALKVIRSELADNPDFRARFAREIASARAVSGAFTAAVLDADPLAPTPWLATEFVAGPSLSEALREHGPLPVESVLALAGGLAEALAVIHRAGVIHRDLKPSNVLLAADGPRVIDFGISRAAESSELTSTGMVVGSPGFMSPEQVGGLPITPATDVFSLGAVLSFAATGNGPFGEGPTPALLYRVVHDQPNLGGVPAELRGLVAACLAKDPAERPGPDALLDRVEAAEQAGPRHDPTVAWLPTQLTGMIARVEAEAPSRGSVSFAEDGLPPDGRGVPTGGSDGASSDVAAARSGGPGSGVGAGGPASGGSGGGSGGGSSTGPGAGGPASGGWGAGSGGAAIVGSGGGTGAGSGGGQVVPGFGPAPVVVPGVARALPGSESLSSTAGGGAGGGATVVSAVTGGGAAVRRRPRWAVPVAALVVLAVAGGVALLLRPSSDKSPGTPGSSSTAAATSAQAGGSPGASADTSPSAGRILVPSVVGDTVDYAIQKLEAAGFSSHDITVSYVCSQSAGGVDSQSVTAGSQVPDGSRVRLGVGESCVRYPDEIGRAVAYAKSDLSDAGFGHVSVDYVCEGAAAGVVVSQYPSAGSGQGVAPPSQSVVLGVQASDCTSTGTSTSPSSSASTSTSSSTSATPTPTPTPTPSASDTTSTSGATP